MNKKPILAVVSVLLMVFILLIIVVNVFQSPPPLEEPVLASNFQAVDIDGNNFELYSHNGTRRLLVFTNIEGLMCASCVEALGAQFSELSKLENVTIVSI
ncbi:MAG TPA: hypothetical protein ENN76_03645, partial [Euryarchaeota archaeon]|nr:hypothetical protein [Euryarchaeota archaeon]